MSSLGLPLNLSPARSLPTLPAELPALRIDVRSRAITEATPALAALIGCDTDTLIGRPLADLWPPPEREAILRRFHDVVLYSRDVFGALALARDAADPVWVEIDARYDYHGGQRIEAVLTPFVALRIVPPDQGRPVAKGVPMQPEGRAPVPRLPGARHWRDDITAAWRVPPTHRDMAAPGSRPCGAEAVSAGAGVMDALRAAAAAAFVIGADGLIQDATPMVERMLARSKAWHGRRLEQVFIMADAAVGALAEARRNATRQSVLATHGESEAQMIIEWLPGPTPGAGWAILAPSGPETECARGRFQPQSASYVAHDVRESLAAVYCGLHAIADALAPDDPMRETADLALAECQRVHRIVDDVLVMSRPGNLVEIELDLDTVVHETVSRYRARAAGRSIDIVERLGSGSRISADLSSLDRAFGNLIENALDATRASGTVTIATARDDRHVPGVRVSIADTGVGIKEETRPNIFKPFYTEKDGGTGLGLAITRRVVLDHHGQIDFETSEGRGTTFQLWLPRVAPRQL